MADLTIQAINLRQSLALRSDGETVPITNMLDFEGDETEDFEEAVSFVAGSDSAWFSGAVADYPTVKLS